MGSRLELGARIGMRAGQRGELTGGLILIGVGVAIGACGMPTARPPCSHRADIADESEASAAVTAAADALGGLDILVNNAGIVSECTVAEMSVAEWDRVIAVNLRGPFLCTRAALPGMLAQGHGRIINVASQLGQLGGETMAHYSASKAGLIGFTKALAREVPPGRPRHPAGAQRGPRPRDNRD
jgi:NAD(P)-dependent dehydrogenase (short-subunit alcohol dehydrogenase family)